MLERIQKLFWFALGYRSIAIAAESPTRLELRYGALETVFDRVEGKITQNGVLVAVLSLVDRVELRKPAGQEGTPNWFVAVHVGGLRQVHVGQVTEDAEASMIGARIATITGRPVTVLS